MKYYNITAAQAVDREFVDIEFVLLACFGCPWTGFGVPLAILAPTWLSFCCAWAIWGPHWVPRGSLGGPLDLPWGSLGGPLGVPWGALGCTGRFSQICRKLDTQFRANVFICTRLCIESSLPELAYGAYGARGNGSQSAAQTPPGHTRRGLGLRELNKLPQTIGNAIGDTIGNTIGNQISNSIGNSIQNYVYNMTYK